MNHHEQIDRSFDGQLTQDEWDALQKAIIADPELRRAYVEKRWLHAQLQADGELLPSLLAETEAAAPTGRALASLQWFNVAALVFLALLATALLFRGSDAPTVATLIEANGCRWEGSDLPTREGAKLGVGRLALAEGMATIQFDSGATVTLEAPTVLEVESAMHCQLVEGSVVAEVPESAHGFTIDTDKMKVVDLGTRFGVTNNSLGGSQVFVFEGEVTVQRDNETEVKHLLTGKSMHTGMTSPPPGQEADRAIVQASPKAGNWTAISTATGQGKDGYMRRGDAHGAASQQPVLMVKHTDLAENNERRGLLTFDLSQVGAEGGAIADAIMTLKIESSGLGFAALVPDSKFAVYGVLDPAIDEWREDELTWANADDKLTAETLDPARYVRLAEFEIKKGSSHNLVEVSSEALGAFINDRRTSDVASLVLIRETGEMDPQGLVHAFASKEHPIGPPPTLWINKSSSSPSK